MERQSIIEAFRHRESHSIVNARNELNRKLVEGELSQSEWEDYVIGESGLARGLMVTELPPSDVQIRGQGREAAILREMYEIEKRLTDESDDVFSSYILLKSHYLKSLAKEIRTRRQYYILPKLADLLLENHDDISRTPDRLFNHDVQTLYLLVCQPYRFLVGTKDGVYWKRVKYPDGFGVKTIGEIQTLGGRNLQNLKNIGQREMVVVPEAVLELTGLKDMSIPKPSRSIESLLEDAFYRQRYIVPPEGAEVRFRKAGELESMILIQSGQEIYTKSVTKNGEGLVTINLNSAEWHTPGSGRGAPENQYYWANVVAEVYHDLVTAVEAPTTRFRTLGRRKATSGVEEVELEERPQVIYIPRVVRTGQKPEVRLPYDGPDRPITPYRVEGHRRRANMTEEHRQRILQFERDYGIKILENLPAGFTFVRPHFVPADAGKDITDLPVFIKKRIETRLAENLQRPTN